MLGFKTAVRLLISLLLCVFALLPAHAAENPNPWSRLLNPQASLRLEDIRALHPSISLEAAAAMAVNQRDNLFFGLLLGALGMLMVYHLVQVAYTRSASGLWLAAALSGVLLSTLSLLDVGAPWLDAWPAAQAQFAELSMLLTLVCALAFTRSFFRPVHPATWLHEALRVEIALIAAFYLLSLIVPNLQFSAPLEQLAVLCTLSIFSVSLYHWRQADRPAQLFSLAWLVIGGAQIAALLVRFGYWPVQVNELLMGILMAATLSGLMLGTALRERQRSLSQAQFDSRYSEAASGAELKGKNEFLATVSHDIRSPMSSVLGMTELLLGTPLSVKQHDYVQSIHNSGNELLSLLNETLELADLESGQLELDDVPFDLKALADNCLRLFRAKAHQQNIELIDFIQPQVPRLISGDPARLKQILLCLLEHAFKQTPAGEVLLAIILDSTGPETRLRISVQDSGRRLSSSECEALLTAQLHSPELHTLGGSLGLLIARQLVLLMGGEVGIQCGATHGNTLWLSLPLRPVLGQSPGTESGSLLRGARLLVVDDDDSCRKVVMQQCKFWGMKVSAVSSGVQALALLRSKAHLGEAFDIVLLEQNMPGMSGLQLAARIQQDRNINQDIRLIMLTGMRQAPSKLSARDAGIKRILSKPVAGYTLKATLANELALRKHGSAAVSTHHASLRPETPTPR
ncbi:MAG: 7TM diverse intracellular signaling domain-containing protein [Pseudomonas sp.]